MSKILRLLNISENTSLNNRLPLVAGMMDNKDLSKSKSGMPNRYSLAFFVPNYRLTSQVNDIDSIAPLTHFTGLNRHIYAHSVTNYDEVTPQNKIAERRICGAVAFTTESEPCLTPFWDKQIIITQNVKGVANHG